MKKIFNNLELLFTIICAFLIVLGLILQTTTTLNIAPFYILAVAIGGYFPAKEGFGELFFERHLSVDILMILAAIGACLIGDWFEGAMLIFIFALAETLESMAMARSQKAISELLSLTPNTARVYRNNELVEVETSSLVIGDVIQIRKGEIVPIDCELISEFSQINEAAITGESLPVDKVKHDAMIGGTLNLGEAIDAVVTTHSDNTLFAKIIKMVEQAQSTPSKTASFIEQIEDIYVKGVLISVPLFIAFMFFVMQLPFDAAFYRGMVLLTVASPCALVASATPATLSAISRASKNHILFKGGITLDKTSRINTIVFDKTGTLTTGQIKVIHEWYTDDSQKALIQSLVKTVETTSTHPIAQALVGQFSSSDTLTLQSFSDYTGLGLHATYQNDEWKIGKRDFALKQEQLQQQKQLDALINQGMTIIYVSKNNELVAYFGLADTIKDNSAEAIKTLQQLNIETVMLTGDHQDSAMTIANSIGIDNVVANCLPQDKVEAIITLQNKDKSVAMVGDGINDAPALAVSDVSFAMGSGSDIAMESADVILMKNDLSQIPFAIHLSKKLNSIIIQNIIFSLSVIVLLILTNILQLINLPFGVIAHEGSTILVILNGLRLLTFKDK